MLKSYKPSFSSALKISALMGDPSVKFCEMHSEKLSVSPEIPSVGFRLSASAEVLI